MMCLNRPDLICRCDEGESCHYLDEKEKAVQFYLSVERPESLTDILLVSMWLEGQAIYAERCKALLKAVTEYSDES